MAINLDTRVSGVARNEGFAQTINPAPFVNAFNSTIQTGQQLQALGGKGSAFALAEQKLYNTTQTDMLNIERKTTMNEFVNNQRKIGKREFLEDDYRRGFAQINKEIVKKAPNDLIKALVAAEGNNYFATNFPSIQKEARVYRLNAQKTQVLDRVRALRTELTQTDNLLRKQEIYKDINKLLIGGQDQGSLDPDEVSKELFEVAQVEESARLTRQLFQAETETEVDTILAKAKYMDDPQTKALLEIRAYGWVAAKRRANIAAQDKATRLARESLEKRQDAYERDISVRLYASDEVRIRDFGEDSEVTMEELIDKVHAGDISQPYFGKRKEEIIQGFVFKDRQTDPTEFRRVSELVEKQLKDPYAEHIGIDDIELNELISNKHRTLLQERLMTGKRTEADNVQQTFLRKLKAGLQIETFMALGKDGDVKAKNAILYQYDLRTNPLLGGKENPIDVYNELMGDELGINTPSHKLNKLRLQGLKDRILRQFRVFVKGIDKDTGDVLDVPDVAAMKAKIKAAVADGFDKNDASDMTDVLRQMEDIGWTAEVSEKYGGIKSKKTLNAEKKERERKAAEAERLAEQKRREELRRQEEDRLREEARIAREKADAEEAARHQKEMEARKVVEAQEKEQLAMEEAQREADKQMRSSLDEVSRIAKSFNIDPDRLVESIEPLFQEMGGLEQINQALRQAAEEKEAKERAAREKAAEEKARREEGARRKSEAKVIANRAAEKQAAKERAAEKQAARKKEVEKAQEEEDKRLAAELKQRQQEEGKLSKEREAQQKSEAKVMANRAARQKEAEAKKEADKNRAAKLRRLQQEAQDKKDFANLAEIEKALAKKTTGLGNKTEYPDERLLKRLQNLENRNIGIGEKLSPIEAKEMEVIKKEITIRKLTPLPLG